MDSVPVALKPRSPLSQGYSSHLNPIKIITLSGTAQEQPRTKGSGAEGSVGLAAEEGDQAGLKAIHISSDICFYSYNARLSISGFHSAYPVAIN